MTSIPDLKHVLNGHLAHWKKKMRRRQRRKKMKRQTRRMKKINSRTRIHIHLCIVKLGEATPARNDLSAITRPHAMSPPCHLSFAQREKPVTPLSDLEDHIVHMTVLRSSSSTRAIATPHHTTPYHTIPYHTIPYHTVPHHTTPHHTIPYHTIPHHTPHHTTPHHTIPYHTTPHHTTPHHTTPYHTIPYHYNYYHLRKYRMNVPTDLVTSALMLLVS
ncbi:SH3 domain-binding glutamic acid-rich protein isoform X9 [Brienomyrus brachyistius]|uniref:SH3 domain-binding glutamic acid-rich protein isoform X9 n=1 Tax=Brienomyrus brachyistius TaxID=42636 RepID=UPI0020B324FE|nr:SH3 domain-binding glutamic acid-rich protein isoform X9 [Brienomyrus brachyistius]